MRLHQRRLHQRRLHQGRLHQRRLHQGRLHQGRLPPGEAPPGEAPPGEARAQARAQARPCQASQGCRGQAWPTSAALWCFGRSAIQKPLGKVSKKHTSVHLRGVSRDVLILGVSLPPPPSCKKNRRGATNKMKVYLIISLFNIAPRGSAARRSGARKLSSWETLENPLGGAPDLTCVSSRIPSRRRSRRPRRSCRR